MHKIEFKANTEYDLKITDSTEEEAAFFNSLILLLIYNLFYYISYISRP